MTNRFGQSRSILFAWSLLAISTVLMPASSARAAVSPDAVDRSIAKGIAYLYSAQKPDGTWESEPAPPPGPLKGEPADRAGTDLKQYGGQTALAVYALLEAGEKPTEPKLKKAIEFLRTTASVSTYVLSVRCQVWADLPATNEVKQALRRDAAALLAGKKQNEAKQLVWDYAQYQPPRYNYTLNNVQSAAWGLSAAGQTDFEVPPEVWRQIDKTFQAAQLADGSFGYMVPTKKTPSPSPGVYYTATGVSALYLAQDFSRADAYAVPRGNVTNPQIDKGIAWISGQLDRIKQDNAASSESPHRRWYGVGAVALASGLRKLNTHDWYADGAADLLERQFAKSGNWGTVTPYGDYRVNDTAWAILFLQRGRVPVAFNKLDYSPAAADAKKALWDQRPRDAANAAKWIGRATERDLRWQIVSTDDTVAAMLEAPVLYVAGGETLNLNADAKAKLKTYVESGGLIFAVADAANAAFSKSVEKLASELFPGNEWRDVPDSHPILANQMFKRAAFKGKPTLRAIGNGVREFVVLAPVGDPARTWQQRSGKLNPDAWQLAADVLSYAVDKSHFYARGRSWLVPATADVPRRTVRLGRLKYNGAWDPEPLAFTQFENYARTRDLGVTCVTVAATGPIKDVDVLYVTGAAAFSLDAAARDAIKTYLDGGGRVIFEAAGGNAAFANSAQAELTRWYGADAIKVLPPTHAIYGEKLAVAYRNSNQGSIERPTGPQLRGVEKDGRLVAILSREDVSAGLLGVPTDGITGYAPASARALLLRVLSKWN